MPLSYNKAAMFPLTQHPSPADETLQHTTFQFCHKIPRHKLRLIHPCDNLDPNFQPQEKYPFFFCMLYVAFLHPICNLYLISKTLLSLIVFGCPETIFTVLLPFSISK